MEGQCIFRCQFSGRKFSVVAQDNPKVEGSSLFWTYEGRKRLDAFPWNTLAGAIGSILCEQNARFMVDLRKVWL